MDFGKWVKDAIEIIKLDEDAIRRAASDDLATLPALLFIAIGGLASAVGSLNPIGIVGIILVPAMMAVWVGLLWIIAKMLGGTGEYLPQLRPIGLASAVNWITVIPILGPLLAVATSLWHLVVTVVTVKAVHNFSTGKAVAVVIIPLAVCGACLAGVVMMAVAAGVGAGIFEAFRNAN